MRVGIWWVAVVVVGLFVLGPDNFSATPSARGLVVREHADRLEFRWRGPVDAPMVAAFEDAFDRWTEDARPFVIALDSGGGSIAEGSKLMERIRREKRSREVETAVAAGGMCASMCVPIYLAGDRRTASPRARFMFHEVRFDQSATAEIDEMLSSLQKAMPSTSRSELRQKLVEYATDMFFREYLAPRVDNEAWLAGIRKSVPGRDVWRSAADLVKENTGIVHALE